MKKIKQCCVFVIIVLITNMVFANNTSIWKSFCESPDMGAFLELEKNKNANLQNSNQFIPELIYRKCLYDSISKGNQWALRAAFLIFDSFDGGELEDFNRSVGSFVDRRPSLFLKIIHEKNISDSEFKGMLTMFPLSTADDIDLELSMIAYRINVLEEVADNLLEKKRDKAIMVLKSEQEELYKIKIQIDGTNK